MPYELQNSIFLKETFQICFNLLQDAAAGVTEQHLESRIDALEQDSNKQLNSSNKPVKNRRIHTTAPFMQLQRLLHIVLYARGQNSSQQSERK
jgi:hypothetical protein